MYSFIGLPLENAEIELQKLKLRYTVVKYNSRFKDNIDTDSYRVVRQRQGKDGSVELTVSAFKTISQSR